MGLVDRAALIVNFGSYEKESLDCNVVMYTDALSGSHGYSDSIFVFISSHTFFYDLILLRWKARLPNDFGVKKIPVLPAEADARVKDPFS